MAKGWAIYFTADTSRAGVGRLQPRPALRVLLLIMTVKMGILSLTLV